MPGLLSLLCSWGSSEIGPCPPRKCLSSHSHSPVASSRLDSGLPAGDTEGGSCAPWLCDGEPVTVLLTAGEPFSGWRGRGVSPPPAPLWQAPVWEPGLQLPQGWLWEPSRPRTTPHHSTVEQPSGDTSERRATCPARTNVELVKKKKLMLM